MRVSSAHRRHWQECQARERKACESRRLEALQSASTCAEALKLRWSVIDDVWLFGSTINGTFGMASDIDLAVEGLPKHDFLEAMAEAKSSAGGIPVDLVRMESLQPHWQQRIRERGRRLP
jgi:predicted nucleotidyltransferase